MNEADKIRMDRLEQQAEALERENKALRKELFKYKLKSGEIEEDTSAEDILEKIRQRRKQDQKDDYKNKIYQKKVSSDDYGKKIWDEVMRSAAGIK